MSKDKDEKNLMVIDTDCGIDDALAIMLALSFKDDWKILAITCCHGNTSLDNASKNVLKVLNLCGISDVPVYKGCDRPLLAAQPVRTVHGDDGLGNVGHEYSSGDLVLSEGHAVNALVQLARQYKGRIHLVGLAPLTNIAMAHRMDPEFTSNLKSFTFMGGNIRAVGNTTPNAEFNFYCDPEASHIVVTEAKCPVTMVPWETTLEHGIDWDFYEIHIRSENERSNFLKKITTFRRDVCKKRGNPNLLDCDLLGVSALVYPACVQLSVKVPLCYDESKETTDPCVTLPSSLHKYAVDNKSVNIIQKFDDFSLRSLRNMMISFLE